MHNDPSASHSDSAVSVTEGWHSIYGQVPDTAGLYPDLPVGCRFLLDQSGYVWSIYDTYLRALHTPYGSTRVFGRDAVMLDLWDNDFYLQLACSSHEEQQQISHCIPQNSHDMSMVTTIPMTSGIPQNQDTSTSMPEEASSSARMNDNLMSDCPTHLFLHASEMTRKLPLELCMEIMIISAHNEHAAARTMSLVCKDWRSIGQGLLFRCLAIGKISGPQRSTLHSTMRLHNWRLFAARPHLAVHIRTILIGSNPGFTQAKHILSRLGNRDVFPKIERFIITTGSSSRLLFEALPQLERLELSTDMMKPSSSYRRLEHIPDNVKEVDIHTHERMVDNVLETLGKSPSARTLKKATLSTILYSFDQTPLMGLNISKLTSLMDLRVRFSLATRCHGFDPAMRVFQHHTLTRLTVDMPDRHHRYVPEDILRAMFGGANVPRLCELKLIIQLPAFKRSKYDLQIALWHKSRASSMWEQPILPVGLANQLTSLVVHLESGDMHCVSFNLAHVVVEDTRFLNLLAFGLRQDVLRVEHKDGVRIIYPDEAMSLGLIEGDPWVFSRKRKAHTTYT